MNCLWCGKKLGNSKSKRMAKFCNRQHFVNFALGKKYVAPRKHTGAAKRISQKNLVGQAWADKYNKTKPNMKKLITECPHCGERSSYNICEMRTGFYNCRTCGNDFLFQITGKGIAGGMDEE